MEVPLIPVMYHRWRAVTFAHWRYEPAIVQTLLPAGLQVETFDGSAWVGLIPFRMDDVRPPGLPSAPWLSVFPETNVRTYVRGPEGETGIWFMSLDAARLAAVLAGRVGYGLRYCWSEMRVETGDDHVVYRSTRRWPGPRGAGCQIRVEVGQPLATTDALDRWLTERRRLYTRIGGRLATAVAEHPPWQLRTVSLIDFDDSLVTAAGLPAPLDPPMLHHSDGTSVRIRLWQPVHRMSGRG